MTAEQEYIITENQLDEIFAFLQNPPMMEIPEFTLAIEQEIRSRPHTPAPDEKHEPRNTIERAEARATRAATLATLDTILKDLSGRSYIGLAIERVERERGRGWLREQLKESLRKQEGA